jgi:hypothetical protein
MADWKKHQIVDPFNDKEHTLYIKDMTKKDLDAALMNWSVREKNHTTSNFCKYINSKSAQGWGNFQAKTEEEYEKTEKPSV